MQLSAWNIKASRKVLGYAVKRNLYKKWKIKLILNILTSIYEVIENLLVEIPIQIELYGLFNYPFN